MTSLIFSARGCPSYPFYSFKRGPWSPVLRENRSREVATKDHSSSNPPKGNPPDLKTKVDVSKVDVKGFPTFCPLCWLPLFLSFSRHLFALFSSSTGGLFCRARGTAQGLERSSLRMDLSTKFGKERSVLENVESTQKVRDLVIL